MYTRPDIFNTFQLATGKNHDDLFSEEVSWPAGALEEPEFDNNQLTKEQVDQEQEEMEKVNNHK